MASKDYLNVNEMAGLFGLNVQTLHYYDKVGIFKPNYRDPQNGYRKYRFDQMYALASIRYMRKLGYSIEDVRNFQNSRSSGEALEKLKKRSADIRAQWEELMRIDHAIMRKIQFIEESNSGLDLSSVQIEEHPERRYIPIGSESEIFTGESFYFYPTIVFYSPDSKQFGALLTDAKDLPGEETPGVNLSVIPKGRYLTCYHVGPYENIQKSFDRLREHGKDLCLDETILAVNIIDQFVENDKEKYITRLEIRVL